MHPLANNPQRIKTLQGRIAKGRSAAWSLTMLVGLMAVLTGTSMVMMVYRWTGKELKLLREGAPWISKSLGMAPPVMMGLLFLAAVLCLGRWFRVNRLKGQLELLQMLQDPED